MPEGTAARRQTTGPRSAPHQWRRAKIRKRLSRHGRGPAPDSSAPLVTSMTSRRSAFETFRVSNGTPKGSECARDRNAIGAVFKLIDGDKHNEKNAPIGLGVKFLCGTTGLLSTFLKTAQACQEKLGIRFGVLKVGCEHFHGFSRGKFGELASQHDDSLIFVGMVEQFLAARARFDDMNRRERCAARRWSDQGAPPCCPCL